MAENNQRNTKGQFIKGHKGGPGRPLGSRVKLEEEMVADMCAVWKEHGKQALETIAIREPAKFAQVAVALVPKHQTITRKVEQMSDRELADLLATMNSKVSDGLSDSVH